MNAIVSASDYSIPPYTIPLSEEVAVGFSGFVLEEQENILKKILGRLLYSAFDAGITWTVEWSATTSYALDALVVSGDKLYKSLQAANLNHALTDAAWWVEVTDNRWFKLYYGSEYTENSKTYSYGGIKALIKPYIYSEWLAATFDNHSGNGIVVANNENAEMISPRSRIVKSWNDFYKRVGNCHSVHDTLYGYLYNSDDTYLDVVEDEYSTITEYMSDAIVDVGTKNVFDL